MLKGYSGSIDMGIAGCMMDLQLRALDDSLRVIEQLTPSHSGLSTLPPVSFFTSLEQHEASISSALSVRLNDRSLDTVPFLRRLKEFNETVDKIVTDNVGLRNRMMVFSKSLENLIDKVKDVDSMSAVTNALVAAWNLIDSITSLVTDKLGVLSKQINTSLECGTFWCSSLEFKWIPKTDSIPSGWRQATSTDVAFFPDQWRKEMKHWSICLIADGEVRGPGYGYVVVYGNFEGMRYVGERLLAKMTVLT